MGYGSSQGALHRPVTGLSIFIAYDDPAFCEAGSFFSKKIPPLLRRAGSLLPGRPISRIPSVRVAADRMTISLWPRFLAASPPAEAGQLRATKLALAPDRVFHGAPLGAVPRGLLPHVFNLTWPKTVFRPRSGPRPRLREDSGGVFSVALSLGFDGQALFRQLDTARKKS